MLKNRSVRPPGGWKFTQPQTGWSLPHGFDFKSAVNAIINHRKSNPRFKLPIEFDVVSDELDQYTCHLLRYNPSYCVEAAPMPFTTSPTELRKVAGKSKTASKKLGSSVTKFVENTTAGIKLYIDWFGEGKPVAQDLAENRAIICSDCPQNIKQNIFAWFTGIVAREIMAVFSMLNDLNLHTKSDDQLFRCNACDCPLKAKVWAPLHIIKKHIRDDAFAALDERCWIRHEKSEEQTK